MKILIDIGHPAHVHFFKNFIKEMELQGSKVMCAVVEKEVNLDLLEHYNICYEILDKTNDSVYEKIFRFLYRIFRLLKIARKFNPDIIIGIANVYGSQIGKLIDKPSIWFHDSEASHFVIKLTTPFAECVLTPDCYNSLPRNSHHVKYPGYHELAYLHPNRFSPDQSVLDDLGININQDFFVLRFGLWNASHDVFHTSSFSLLQKIKLVKTLEQFGKVIISSGELLPKALDSYRFNLGPERFHDVMYYSKMVITDSQTTTAEAGDLGVPAIRCNSYVNRSDDMSYIVELEKKYDLVYSFNEFEPAFAKILELIKTPNLKSIWKSKRDKMLKDKIDVTSFIVWFVSNYPDSIYAAEAKLEAIRGCS